MKEANVWIWLVQDIFCWLLRSIDTASLFASPPRGLTQPLFDGFVNHYPVDRPATFRTLLPRATTGASPLSPQIDRRLIQPSRFSPLSYSILDLLQPLRLIPRVLRPPPTNTPRTKPFSSLA